MEDNRLVSVVVPMYFEQDVAEECYRRLKKTATENNINYEFIFVNDGSTDGTLDILKKISDIDKDVKVIDFARNFGHQVAVTAGIFHAKGDAVVLIDADLQDPPELIVDMINKWQEGYDVVYGKRAKRKGESPFKLITAKYFYRFLDLMSEIKIPKDTGDFRLMDRRVVEAFKMMPEKNRFIRGMVSWIGFNQTYIEYERDERFAGETKYPLKKMIRFAADGIISFSSKPLKLVTKLGLYTIGASLILLAYIIFQKIFLKSTIEGWASIMVVIIFFSGIQTFSLGIIGSYISRIYDESKNRPLYLIKDKINFDE